MKNKKHTMRQDLIIAQRDGFFHTVTKASDNHTSESLLTEVYMTIYTCYNLNQLEEQLSFNKITRCRLQQNLQHYQKYTLATLISFSDRLFHKILGNGCFHIAY